MCCENRLPANVSLSLGALIEPLSVAMHAHTRAALKTSSTVLVLGAGAIGLLVAAVAKAQEASRVVIADIQQARLDFATANGYADASFLVPAERPDTIGEKLAYAQKVAELAKATTDSRGTAVGEVDCVFECTGVETCVQTAIYVRPP